MLAKEFSIATIQLHHHSFLKSPLDWTGPESLCAPVSIPAQFHWDRHSSFKFFPEDKLQGTRNSTQTILSSCLHSLCKICISKFERICWLGHTSDLLLAGQAVHWRSPWHLNVLCYAWVVLPSNFEPNSSKIRDYLLYCFFKKTDKS